MNPRRVYKYKPIRWIPILAIFAILLSVNITQAQDPTPDGSGNDLPSDVPSQVDVQQVAEDEDIANRLYDIYTATGWFTNPEVTVQDGVVFLRGETQSEEFKVWAGNLARNTESVAAVVNQLEIIEPPLLDFAPMLESLRQMGRSFFRAIPLIGFSILILVITWLIARLVVRFTHNYLQTRELNILLRNVTANSVGILVFLGGLYVVFQIAGLTNIALTIIGGTGLLGLIVGIAFRDITENFLASIFLSVQNPFSVGDLVEISDVQGFVQNMTTRTTILMTLAGNHVQIPNATVYKSIIHNYTSNPNRRIDFIVGVGYDDSISLAQEVIRKVLEDHPAVLNDPESLVLVNNLGSATVNLQIYFWIDGTKNSWLKVKSSVIRLVKRAVQEAGISMPDEAREMIFPQGVPVHMVTTQQDTVSKTPTSLPQPTPPVESDTVSTSAEGDLSSEADVIESQARQSRSPELGENLLKSDTPQDNPIQ